MDLSAILKNQLSLFSFMQFLKEENCMNKLQFCLSVEDFNKQIMNPDLNEDELDSLHSEAVYLFNHYLKQDAPQKLNISSHLITEIFQGKKNNNVFD